MEHINQIIWAMLEELGYDLENDNDASEICDKYCDAIEQKIKNGAVSHLIKSSNKDWERKRIHYVHETNSGVSLIKGNVKIAKRYIKLYQEGKSPIDVLISEMDGSFRGILGGVQKVKDSQDYIYNEIKDL